MPRTAPDLRPRRGTIGPAVTLAIVLPGILLCSPSRATAQAGGVNQGGPEAIHSQAGMDPLPQKGTTKEATQAAQMREAERRRRLNADMLKLLQLSTDLKAEIDQSSDDQLSVDALRKASEIEKLAKDIKSWLKYQ